MTAQARLSEILDLPLADTGLVRMHPLKDTVITVHRLAPSSWRWRDLDFQTDDIVAAVFVISGHIIVRGATSPVGALLSSDDAEFAYPTPTTVAVAWVRRSSALRSAPTADFTPRVLDSSHLALSSRAFVLSLARLSHPVDDREKCAVDHATIAVVGALARGHESDATDEHASLFERANALIAANSSDSAYSVQKLAAELFVSVRHLQRAFADHDDTPYAALRRSRVERARALSDDPQTVSLPQHRIAVLAGFPNASALRRAFSYRRS
ncbi:AraC family transcriptional regulator [Microbacterium sp. 18062]|uniref:AraC family transcriptional regulator n=1 Tax=Microbacterium sp. 18062 TaxID=2681410 RepID=UPI001359C86A|nr:AraC family transcriptional regulator [Microbacterium sp. 18062]